MPSPPPPKPVTGINDGIAVFGVFGRSDSNTGVLGLSNSPTGCVLPVDEGEPSGELVLPCPVGCGCLTAKSYGCLFSGRGQLC